MMADSGPSGAVLNYPDVMPCKSMGCFFFKFAYLIEGFSNTSLCHTALVPSVVLFFVPVHTFLVGMVLSGSPVAACFRSEIARFYTCKSTAIWAIETPLLT